MGQGRGKGNRRGRGDGAICLSSNAYKRSDYTHARSEANPTHPHAELGNFLKFHARQKYLMKMVSILIFEWAQILLLFSSNE